MKWNKNVLLILAFAVMLIGAGCSSGNGSDVEVDAPAENGLEQPSDAPAVEPEGGATEESGTEEAPMEGEDGAAEETETEEAPAATPEAPAVTP